MWARFIHLISLWIMPQRSCKCNFKISWVPFFPTSSHCLDSRSFTLFFYLVCFLYFFVVDFCKRKKKIFFLFSLFKLKFEIGFFMLSWWAGILLIVWLMFRPCWRAAGCQQKIRGQQHCPRSTVNEPETGVSSQFHKLCLICLCDGVFWVHFSSYKWVVNLNFY